MKNFTKKRSRTRSRSGSEKKRDPDPKMWKSTRSGIQIHGHL